MQIGILSGTGIAMTLLALLAAPGCGKNDGSAPPLGAGVYVSGAVAQGSSTNSIAAYWKGTTAIPLTNITNNTAYAVGEAMAISGNDLYVAGYQESSSGDEMAMVWKNGVGTTLPASGSLVSTAAAITIQGSDVYVAGDILNSGVGYNAVYWKNGVPTTLPNQGYPTTVATAIAVQGSDIYVTGWRYAWNSSEVAVYWINGTEHTLTDSTSYATTTGIAVQGSNVYISGWVEKGALSTATYWLNGSSVSLTDGTRFTMASGIALQGNDVYIAGTGSEVDSIGGLHVIGSSYLMYWKNGSLQDPLDSTDQSPNMNAGAIAVSGGDVYIAGTFDGLALYWKDGSPIRLTGQKSIGLGIALAP